MFGRVVLQKLTDVSRRAYCLHHYDDGGSKLPLKCRPISTTIHSETCQKTAIFMLAAVTTSNITKLKTIRVAPIAASKTVEPSKTKRPLKSLTYRNAVREVYSGLRQDSIDLYCTMRTEYNTCNDERTISTMRRMDIFAIFAIYQRKQ
jgi:hypothetical protein